ncbi:hypothetical protein JOM56_001742 [Amanita muscaria]
MTKRRWTTAEQLTWLESKLPAYLKAKDEKSTRDFFFNTWKLFAEQWPVDAPSAKEIQQAEDNKDLAQAKKTKATESQFRTWFNNHTRATSSGMGTRQVLNLGAGPKLVQHWQAFQNLHWETGLRDKVEDAWKAYKDGFPDGCEIPLSRFAFRNQKLRQWYTESSEETKAAVEAHRQVMKDGGWGAEDVNHAYQSAIDKLPRTLQTAAESIAKQTGWHVSILVGGPNPRLGGQIQTIALHHGKTLEAKDFQDYLDDDTESGFVKYGQVMASYDNFLHASFDEEACQKRAIIDWDDDEEGQDDLSAPLSDTSGQQLCEYEKRKSEYIARNQMLLAELGLLNASETLEMKKQPKQRKQKEKKAQAVQEPTRRSARTASVNNDAAVSSVMEIRQDPPSIPDAPPPSLSSSLTPGTFANPPISATPAVQTHVPAPLPSSATPGQTVLNSPNSEDSSPSHVSPQLVPAGETRASSATAAAASCKQVVDVLSPTISSHTSQTATSTSLPRHSPVESTISSVVPTPSDSFQALDNSAEIDDKSVSTDGSPMWYAEWLQYFHDTSDDPKWVDLVSRWLRFEALGPPVCKNLPAKGRPEDVQWWIKRGKAFDNMPSIKKPVEFATIWWGWWKNLQPSWRRVDETDNLSQVIPTDADWSCLLYGHSNGLAVVVMTLAWWIRAFEPAKFGICEHSRLVDAISDVGWVFQELVSVVPMVTNLKESGLKRPNPSKSGNEPALKRLRSRLMVP